MITRFSIIPDERKVLLGIDKANIFKPGVVYQVEKILDEIVIKPVGPYALPEKGHPSRHSDCNNIISSGMHLYTKNELEDLTKILEK
jgi:hypothetical protein